MCHSLNFVAAGIGRWLHDGWSHSHPPGHRHRRGAGPSYSRTKTILGIWTLAGEGEVLGKEVVSYPKGDHPDNNYLMLLESLRARDLIGWDDFPCSNKAAISPPNRKMAEV